MRICELTPGRYDRAKSFTGKQKSLKRTGKRFYSPTIPSFARLIKATNLFEYGAGTAQRQCVISTHLLKCSAFRAAVKRGGMRSPWRKSPCYSMTTGNFCFKE